METAANCGPVGPLLGAAPPAPGGRVTASQGASAGGFVAWLEAFTPRMERPGASPLDMMGPTGSVRPRGPSGPGTDPPVHWERDDRGEPWYPTVAVTAAWHQTLESRVESSGAARRVSSDGRETRAGYSEDQPVGERSEEPARPGSARRTAGHQASGAATVASPRESPSPALSVAQGASAATPMAPLSEVQTTTSAAVPGAAFEALSALLGASGPSAGGPNTDAAARSPEGTVLTPGAGPVPLNGLLGGFAGGGTAGGRDGEGWRGWARDTGSCPGGMANAARVAFPFVAVGTGLPDGALPVLSGAAVREPAIAASSAMSDAAQALMAQIVKAARLAWTQRSGEARLTVNPGGALGEVQVTLHVSRGQVWATLQADRATAAQVLDGARGDLQRALAEHGLDLHRFAVSVNPDGRRRGAPEDNRWARPARSRHGNLRFEDFA